MLLLLLMVVVVAALDTVTSLDAARWPPEGHLFRETVQIGCQMVVRVVLNTSVECFYVSG